MIVLAYELLAALQVQYADATDAIEPALSLPPSLTLL